MSPIDFPVSPGGTPEASPSFVREHACDLRIVDVREPEELHGELGVIEGAESIPQRRVAKEALGWDRDAPVVVVCRSGRRSGAVARELREMGFPRVASMTGGMIAWDDQGFPTVDAASLPPPSRQPAPPPRREITRDDVAAHIADRDRVRWTKAATLMLHGTQACVDGRDAHAIVGTPGGDAGELVLALAVAESRSGRSFTPAEIEQIFDAYLQAFGHFYMHSDDHAAQALVDALAAAGAPGPLPATQDLDAVTRWLNDPPPAVREVLLERLTDPRYVGCGHLRLMLQHSQQYRVRQELVEAVMRAFYRRLWEGHDALELVVLEGTHEESAVVTVELEHEVHAYSKIPLVSPRLQDSEVFVAHPQVARFVRRENAAFLLEQLPALGAGEEEEFFAALQRLADHQLQATLDHLAPTLDHYHVRFRGEDFEVLGPQAMAAE